MSTAGERKLDRRIVVTVSNHDASGCTGVPTDLKVFAMHGLFGCAVVTQVGARTSDGVVDLEVIPARFVRRQIASLLSDLPVRAVKIGLLPTRAIVQSVVGAFETSPFPLVVDPDFVDRDGGCLLTPETLTTVRDRLVPLASVLTPNLAEATFLLERPVRTLEEMRAAAHDLVEMGAASVLVKGGHLRNQATDIYYDGRNELRLIHPRSRTPHLRGAGTVLSASVAARLAAGQQRTNAVREAANDVAAVLRNAAPLGKGPGPADPLLAHTRFGVARRMAEKGRREAQRKASSSLPPAWVR